MQYLWLERGLSKNTRDAYQQDLLIFREWLHDQDTTTNK
nr:site-specific integrase [Endozoicomonas ascidiicola]